MGQAQRARKVDNPGLHAHLEKLRRADLTVDRKAVATQFGVSVGTVQAVRHMVDAKLAAENGTSVADFTGGRLVQEFDGRKLYHIRKFRLFLMQEQLADLAGVSRGEVGHLERNLRKPTLKTLRKLADAMAVHPSELLSEGELEHDRRQTA